MEGNPTNYIEMISLPTEKVILGMMEGDEELKELVGDRQVVVVGMDKEFEMATGLLRIFNKSSVLVVDRNKRVLDNFEKFIQKDDVRLTVDIVDVGKDRVEGVNDEGVGLVLAKHLLSTVGNKDDRRNILDGLVNMLDADGVLVLSAPQKFLIKKYSWKAVDEVVDEMMNESSDKWEKRIVDLGNNLFEESRVWILKRKQVDGQVI